ncbi:hypothetical protein H0H93_005440, partial [Arthromyces matolae]
LFPKSAKNLVAPFPAGQEEEPSILSPALDHEILHSINCCQPPPSIPSSLMQWNSHSTAKWTRSAARTLCLAKANIGSTLYLG